MTKRLAAAALLLLPPFPVVPRNAPPHPRPPLRGTAAVWAVREHAPRASRTRPTLSPSPRPGQGGARTTVWDRLAQCESSGRWHLATPPHFGGLQFTLSSWRAVGGRGMPHEASKAEQIVRARRLLALQGWGAWPGCSKALGLR